jgi:hypothetical protein
MDITQVTELRSWADRLEERSTDPELRAAGKAIHMLVGEVESLQAKLAEAQAGAPTSEPPAVAAPAGEPAAASPGDAADPPWAAAGEERTQGSFFSRLKKSFGFD